MRKLLIAVVVLITACSSSAPQNRAPERRERPRGMRAASLDDDLLPPPGWWHSPYISERVNLDNDQMRRLDAIENERRDPITRLSRDLEDQTRALRNTLSDANATEQSITTAGNELARARDQLFRERIALLAAERAVLNPTQWAALQQQLQEEMRPRREERGGFGGGGRRRGGFGGRGGRRPY